MNISKLITSQNSFKLFLSPGGATITFTKNWNFHLIFFVVKPLLENMTSTHFMLYLVRMPKKVTDENSRDGQI